MRISKVLIDEVIAHAREERPRECCGMIGGRDGTATEVRRVTNALPGQFSFQMDPQEQYDTKKAIEEPGGELLGIYHSHPRSEAYPSETDINQARWWPDQVHMIASLEDPDKPVVRAFRILDGVVDEEPLELD